MSISPYKPLGIRLLALFTLLVFSLLVFRPAPQTMAACVKPCVPVAQWLAGKAASRRPFLPQHSRSLTASSIRNTAQVRVRIPVSSGKAKSDAGIIAGSGGPAFTFVSMSDFSVRALFGGRGRVIVFYYGLESGGIAEVVIAAKGAKQPFVIRLPPTNDERKEVIRELPQEFGEKLQVGVLSVNAFKIGPGERIPARFFLYELGVGEKANVVGSMVIDRGQFLPGSIHPKLGEKAFYSFHSLSDFDRVSADFMHAAFSSDGVVLPTPAASEVIKHGVRRDETVSKYWNGKNSKGQISLGPHQFYVRVWRGLEKGGDWVFAATQQIVRVE